MRHKPLGTLAFLAIAAVIAAIIVRNFLRAQSRREFMSCRSNLKNIGLALEIYSHQEKRPYPESLQALVPNILVDIPACPAAGEDVYSQTYKYVPAPAGEISLYSATPDCDQSCWGELEDAEKAMAEIASDRKTVDDLPDSLRGCRHGQFSLGPARGAYSFHCAGHQHYWSGVVANYPVFNSENGLTDRP